MCNITSTSCADYTVDITTKNRYDSTLFSCLQSIVHQTVAPKRIYVSDDNTYPVDLREIPRYYTLFRECAARGIDTYVFFNGDRGQVSAHQHILDEADTEYLWRIDDDEIAEHNVAELLLNKLRGTSYYVAAPSVIQPEMFKYKSPSLLAFYTADIILDTPAIPNAQWFVQDRDITVQNLYSSFMMKTKLRGKVSYCNKLSKVGHHEESILAYEIFKHYRTSHAVVANAVVWHYRDSGGIRSDNPDPSMWDRDRQVFLEYCKDNNITAPKISVVALNGGIGDHYDFNGIFFDLPSAKRYETFLIASCYPEVTEELTVKYDGRIHICSYEELHSIYGLSSEQIDNMNVYKFMSANNWNKTVREAFKELYEKINP